MNSVSCVPVRSHRKLRHDDKMLRDYHKLGRFAAYVLLFLIVVTMQLGIFSTDYARSGGA